MKDVSHERYLNAVQEKSWIDVFTQFFLPTDYHAFKAYDFVVAFSVHLTPVRPYKVFLLLIAHYIASFHHSKYTYTKISEFICKFDLETSYFGQSVHMTSLMPFKATTFTTFIAYCSLTKLLKSCNV